VHGTESLLFFTLLQITLIILSARGAGHVARWLRQPRAVGEIVAGLLLGPSLFGALAPDTFHWLFRSADGTPLTVISQIGLILLMFQVGLEFDFSHLGNRRNRRAALLITAVGIALPFALGLAFGWRSAAELAPGIQTLPYSLFVGIALSITAVPILGRIMMEFGLTRTPLGVVTIAAAAANDAVGWVVLALVAAVASGHLSWPAVATQTGLLVAYLLAAWFVIRPLLRALIRRFPQRGESLPQDLLALLLAVVFASAMITSRLGIFAIFGGFVIGVLLHDDYGLVQAWKNRVEDLVTVFFLPIFFTYTGLRTDLGSLSSGSLWVWCALLVALATLGKLGGCYLAARWAGMTAAESRCIAVMMNTRALMELIVVNLGYDLGVIPREVFTMLVVMAVFSTVVTAPFLRLWLPAAGYPLSGAKASARSE
jgi:Kef-type K+ transport system membrane component KefB